MPFKSESQRRKFAALVKEGKISQATFDEWNKETPEDLPERVTPKKEPAKPAAKRPSGSDPRLTHVALIRHKKQK